MRKVTFSTKSGTSQETFVDTSTEYAARKTVAARADYDMFIACVMATPEEIARIKDEQSLVLPKAPAPQKEIIGISTTKRHDVADAAYQAYEFGDGVYVEDASGWEHSSQSNEWTRSVFVRTDEGDDVGSSEKLTFTVRFKPAADDLDEAYAIDAKGSIWGVMPSNQINDAVGGELEGPIHHG